MPSILIVVQSAADETLTFGRVVSQVPHDAAAFVVYALIGSFIYFIWRGSRPSRRS